MQHSNLNHFQILFYKHLHDLHCLRILRKRQENVRAFLKKKRDTFPDDDEKKKKKSRTGDDASIYTSDSKGNRAHPTDL